LSENASVRFWLSGGAGGADFAQHIERKWDGDDGSSEEEGPTYGLAWSFGKAIREQEAEAGTKSHPGTGDHGEFRDRDLGFSHDSDPL
jgi:hypothetical protein